MALPIMLASAGHAGQAGRDLEGCIVPTAEALHAAQAYLDEPEDPMVTRFNLNFGKSERVDAISKQEYDAWRVQKAAENGRTVHIFKPDGPDPETIIDEKLIDTKRKQAEEFLGRYGITLSFGDDRGKLWGINGKRLTPEQRHDPELVGTYFSLQNFISKYPVEFLQRTGQREIVLMEGEITNLGDVIDNKIAGEVSTAHPNTIYLDYKNPQALDHEIAH